MKPSSPGSWSHEELPPGLPPTATQKALGVILAKTPAEIDQIDTATLNWVCLGGLPGAENIDMDAALARIDRLAQSVKVSTQATLDKMRKKDSTAPDSPQFRSAILFYILTQDYKNVHFADQIDPDHAAQVDWGKERPEDLLFQSSFHNKEDAVISNPVLMVSVAQKLKYPVKLASIPGRLVAMWDDGKTKFIIQPSSEGIQLLTEDECLKAFPATDQEIREANLYHEYTQAETLAVFLHARGKIWEQLGFLPQATLAYAAAHRFSSDTPLFSEYLASAIDSRMRDHNINRKVMDQANAERFNLTPATSPEIKP